MPVATIRFTHDTIYSRHAFKNGDSVFKLLDDLHRGHRQLQDLEPLDACYYEGKLWSMSNRRLVVLLWYQSMHRDKTILAPCHLRHPNWKNRKLSNAMTTNNEGLGIEGGRGRQTSLHRGRALFN